MEHNKVSIPRASTIVVTGVNGYVGSAVAKLLLELGYKVRGTLRAPKPWVNQYFEERFGRDRFETVIVPDFEDLEALNRAFKGAAGILHVAHDMTWHSDPNIAVTKSVNAVVNILNIASQHKCVKRIGDWNDRAVEAVWSHRTPEEAMASLSYTAAKVAGDRKALKFVQENKPQFDVNLVMPGLTLGRVLHPSCTGQPMAEIAALLRGERTYLFDFIPPWFIDIKDVARLHVIALLAPGLSSQRIFACAHPFTWKGLIDILRQLDPANTLIPDAPEETLQPCHVIPATKAERMIQDFFGCTGFTSLRDSLATALMKSVFTA
ncbi:hypothetical protein CNMCM5623_004584 [Aspergillus felis]|uniref:NAD-dependent epimerase/dehydratase domain-containing protein n=1 Tax=Aspergillus felis TaxID=1287682 RepID=A0A8H6QFZ6_9EURO|nr:hypothetical protein CNMCM5623_004584 [Aspergillus felis]KAF7177670.1 hypothetical protein CNMCM7691_006031 [Aspergillus felis]